ncbi:pif-3 [Venturia canescens]|uniref:Pif-3 n=1 Tax=Venturia canescens TaxID=32260 RepID=A0ACB9ZHK3_9HYME|nr:uncharacterized LOC122410071 precursor [Venturia canescens]KAI5630611.1 pif-3 [Venturia canescens]
MHTAAQIFIITILCLAFGVLLFLQSLSSINTKKNNVEFPGSQQEIVKRDCDEEMVYSVDDMQCDKICKGPNLFRVKNGACVNSLAIDIEHPLNVCDPKKGVLAYLLGDPQFGTAKSTCLSIDMGIQPDDGRNNIMCLNGTIKIDYTKKFPQLEDCHCRSGDKLIIIPSTSTIRAHGICVAKALSNLYEFNELVYKKF